MPKRAEHDFAVRAFRVVEHAIGEHMDGSPLTQPELQSRRSAGGKAGGPARAVALTANQRRTIAVKAAKARWERRTNDRKRGRATEEHLKEHSDDPR